MKYIPLKKIFSLNGLLYIILDKSVVEKTPYNIVRLAEKLACAGADIFQLRFGESPDREFLKLATHLGKAVHARKKIFLVNNRADIAYLCGADGVHLGAEDIPVLQARKIIGKSKIVGKTVHSLDELKKFQKEEIDYLSVGPLFRTITKPHLVPLQHRELKEFLKRVRKPLFGIGGITLENLKYLCSVGIRNIALCHGIVLAQNPSKYTKVIKQCLKKAS
ncbi:MAG: thiamine phosphate synthase [Candidatus Omnitrophota bacterium]|nr:MAG: thiamine phosphate synthase [Candidatus Omnitrophota bacterium]